MKLRNKQTGEIAVFGEGIVDLNQIGCKNVAEMLAAGWEDAPEPEEPKDFWFIGEDTRPHWENSTAPYVFVDRLKSIGNYFETKEEAEKAVKKLKAFKRLKDKGFKFDGGRTYSHCGEPCIVYTPGTEYIEDGDYLKLDSQVGEDLDLLFGGGGK